MSHHVFLENFQTGVGLFSIPKIKLQFFIFLAKRLQYKTNFIFIADFFFNQLFEIGIPGNGLERDFLLLLTPASQPDQIEEVKEARLLAASTTPGIGQPL